MLGTFLGGFIYYTVFLTLYSLHIFRVSEYLCVCPYTYKYTCVVYACCVFVDTVHVHVHGIIHVIHACMYMQYIVHVDSMCMYNLRVHCMWMYRCVYVCGGGSGIVCKLLHLFCSTGPVSRTLSLCVSPSS